MCEVIDMSDKISRFKEKLVDTLDFPIDIALGLPKITIIGQQEITVENHKGIIKFEKDELIVNTDLGNLKILGNDLEITLVGGTTITLRGRFKAVVYECYEEDR